ncbi:hypothetical protein OO17_15570 [Rhodopseudomonas palustris]|uniref:Uncharacterized protein n=1 Tax=Rhodopseudomonas palustris TaxID=1076 RepID=A0A0D7EL81_RHOPL|nr:hypothetical protein OO17_15570 [Rhodopseudomonas palustris]
MVAGLAPRPVAQQVLIQRFGRLIGLDIELLAQQRFAALVASQGERGLALVGIEPHQRALDVLLQRINRQQAQRHSDGLLLRPAALQFQHQGAQAGDRGGAQPVPLAQQPFLEQVGSCVEPLQQVAAIERGRAPEVGKGGIGERGAELRDVGGDRADFEADQIALG